MKKMEIQKKVENMEPLGNASFETDSEDSGAVIENPKTL